MKIQKKESSAFGLLLLVFGSAIFIAETNPQKETFTAFAVVSGLNTQGTVSSQVTISIDRWTTDAELADLVGAFNARGQDGLLDVLQKTPRIGYFRMPDSRTYTIEYELHCAFQQPDDQGGRRIFLATDRAIRYFDVIEKFRTRNYPFTVVELRLNKDNRGEGTIAVNAKIIVSTGGKYFDLENYDPLRVLLKSVEKVK